MGPAGASKIRGTRGSNEFGASPESRGFGSAARLARRAFGSDYRQNVGAHFDSGKAVMRRKIVLAPSLENAMRAKKKPASLSGRGLEVGAKRWREGLHIDHQLAVSRSAPLRMRRLSSSAVSLDKDCSDSAAPEVADPIGYSYSGLFIPGILCHVGKEFDERGPHVVPQASSLAHVICAEAFAPRLEVRI